jgi:hypothetical protein
MRRTLLIILLLILVGATAAQPAESHAGRHAAFYLDSPGQLAVADSVITATRDRLILLLGDSLDYIPEIHIVSLKPRFDSLIGGAFPDWGAAAALPTRGLIVIKSPDAFNVGKSLSELLAHEYSHLALAHRTGWHRAPRWFDEGLAMYVSSEWGWSHNIAMSRAALFGDLLPLGSIEEVNRFSSPRAEVAYAESYQAVKYLFDLYRVDAVTVFLDRIREGASIDSALMAATGSTYVDFNAEFGVYLKGRYNLATLFMDTMYFWLFLALVVIVGAILTYRRRRQYYRKWDEHDKQHSTDFDYGDPDKPETPDDDEPWRG